MKAKIVFLIMTLIFCSTVVGFAEETISEILPDETGKVQEGLPSKPEPVAVDNKLCPIEGNLIGSMGPGVEVTHQGKKYKLCCEACVKTFNDDPDKYSLVVEDIMKADAEDQDGDNKEIDKKVSP